MDIVIKVSQFILSLSLLIIIHELGHFLFARLFKIRVEKFYLFFDPWFSLFKFKKGDTEYGIGWVPFGGYVKISGMIDESMDTEQMAEEPKPYEFRSKKAWQRLLVMLGGVSMNVVLAIFIYIGISYTWGDYIANEDLKDGMSYGVLAQQAGFQNGDKIIDIEGRVFDEFRKIQYDILVSQPKYVTVERGGVATKIDLPKDFTERLIRDKEVFMSARQPFVIDSLMAGSNALAAGLMKGDSVLAINSTPIRFNDEVTSVIKSSAGDSVTLTVARTVMGVQSILEIAVLVPEDGKIGVNQKSFIPIRNHNYTLLQSIPAGVSETGYQISGYWKQVKLIFSPKTKASESLGGFLSIGNMFPKEWDWAKFWGLTGFLSIILAVMNILPIPGLDGGHVVFVLYEMITRRKPSDKFMEYVTTAGLILVFALLLYANGNDIYRFFIK